MWGHRADSGLAPSQWEMLLQSNSFSHWLGANYSQPWDTIVLENSLASDRWEVIVWTNEEAVLWCMYSTLSRGVYEFSAAVSCYWINAVVSIVVKNNTKLAASWWNHVKINGSFFSLFHHHERQPLTKAIFSSWKHFDLLWFKINCSRKWKTIHEIQCSAFIHRVGS